MITRLTPWTVFRYFLTKPDQIPWLLQMPLKTLFLSLTLFFLGLITVASGLAGAYGWATGGMLQTQIPSNAVLLYDGTAQTLQAKEISLPFSVSFPLGYQVILESTQISVRAPNTEPTAFPVKELFPQGESFELKAEEVTGKWPTSLALSAVVMTVSLTIGLLLVHVLQAVFFSILLFFLFPIVGFRFTQKQLLKFSLLLLIPAEICWIGASIIQRKPELWVFDVAFWAFAAYYAFTLRRQARIARSA